MLRWKMTFQNKYPEYVLELSKNQRETLRESKTFLYIKANSNVLVIKLDKGIIPSTKCKQRCDFYVYNSNEKIGKFVELKGISVQDACDQIYDSIVCMESDGDLGCLVNGMNLLKGYIVSPYFSVPDIDDTHRKKAYKKLHSKSRQKLEKVYDYLIFIRCVKKIPGRYDHIERGEKTILVSNECPFVI